jgi:hypothetical protein
VAISRAIALCCGVLLIVAGAGRAASASDTLRCGNRLVSIGDNKAEVLIKCGAPAWKDDWTERHIININTPGELRVSVDRERWIYDLGHNSFLRFLLFENGRLVKISTGDYGFNGRHPSAKQCEGGNLQTGISQYEILQRCGQPAFKDSREEEVLTAVDKNSSDMVVKRIDEWTYNFGPHKFMRILKFENGELVKVETGDRGF